MSTGSGVTPGGGVVERTTLPLPRPPPPPCAGPAPPARPPCSWALRATAHAIAIDTRPTERITFMITSPLSRPRPLGGLVGRRLHHGARLGIAAPRRQRGSAQHER